MDHRQPPTPVGRPRSEHADAAILKAALTLLDERGYGPMTVDEIAARACVGKQTIYRRWTSKAALVLEAVTTQADLEVSVPDTGSVRDDVCGLLRNAFAALRSGRQKTVVSLMAEAQFSEDFASAFRDRFIARRRAVLIALLRRGLARGELRPDLDIALLADVIYGAMWYRLLLRHAPLDDAFAVSLTASVFDGAGVK